HETSGFSVKTNKQTIRGIHSTLHSHLYCMVFGASVKNTNKTTWVKMAYMGHREKQYLYILWAMATPIDLDFAFAVAVGSFVWPLGRGFQTVSFC
uniref:Uncharacterized protein n=1 Tax=Sinocyclocheilus anshuiensis TaxID=1608454 RepID=A0A671SLL6_9TELE